MQTLTEIRALLAQRGLSPKHRLGQNFLHDQNQLRKLLAAAEVAGGDLVLEVGPGTGTLTEALVEAGAEVVASELDPDMADIVESRLGERIRLVRGDCLERGSRLNAELVSALGGRAFKLVANLPYQIASPLMAILAGDSSCRGQFVTIQKEVADRLLAQPGGKEYGALGILLQAMCDVRLIGTVPAGCFWPAPQVTSAMVAITPRARPLVRDAESFSTFLSQLFTKRRKQLGSILGRERSWPAGVEERMRPEALSVEQLVALAQEERARTERTAGSG
jgi:16S rRNA (adenine1518-N6/adenine1519-N6)-dimethyltransferase